MPHYKLTPAEQDLVVKLDAMTTEEFEAWISTPKSFNPDCNTARAILASKHSARTAVA